jgi:hypothetical protein
MSNQGVGPAFIDLATYGELESYLYGNPSEPSPYMQIKHKKIIGFIMVVIILYYLKKK